MLKEKSAMKILEASTRMQWSVAELLEAKAIEMEALREWLMHTLKASAFPSENDLVMQTVAYHSLLIEILQGVTKLEAGLASHMDLLIVEEGNVGGGAAFDGLMPFGDGT